MGSTGLRRRKGKGMLAKMAQAICPLIGTGFMTYLRCIIKIIEAKDFAGTMTMFSNHVSAWKFILFGKHLTIARQKSGGDKMMSLIMILDKRRAMKQQHSSLLTIQFAYHPVSVISQMIDVLLAECRTQVFHRKDIFMIPTIAHIYDWMLPEDDKSHRS